MRMLILVPTRGRPENALRLRRRFYETRSDDTYIRFVVDEDDPWLKDYDNLLMGDFIVGPRLRLGGTLNRYAVEFQDQYDIIGFMGDDVYPQTEGWDRHIVNAMRPNGIVYANDGFQGENLPTAVFMDSRIIRTLGYMALPGMTHLFIDNYWHALGTRLDTLTYLPDVYLEHLHPVTGKAETDKTYEEANAAQVWNADEAKLREHINNPCGMDYDVARLLA